TFRFPTDARSSPDMRSFRGLGCAGELSRGESELVHEMPLTVYGTKGWDKSRLTRTNAHLRTGFHARFLSRARKRPKGDQAPSGAVAAGAIASLPPVGGRGDPNPPRVRLRLSLRQDHQIAAANTMQAPSGSGTKNAPNVASAAGDLI